MSDAQAADKPINRQRLGGVLAVWFVVGLTAGALGGGNFLFLFLYLPAALTFAIWSGSKIPVIGGMYRTMYGPLVRRVMGFLRG